jgi:hypothetical protein
MNKTLISALAIALLCIGCESTPHYNRTKVLMMGQALTKKPYGSVKLYEHKEDVPAPYDVMAIMTVDGSSGEEALFMKAFLYRAADMGADGVIFYPGREHGVLQPGWFAYGYWSPARISPERAYRGEAIHFK